MNNINIHSTVFMREHFLKYHLIENVMTLQPDNFHDLNKLSAFFTRNDNHNFIRYDMDFVLFYCFGNDVEKGWSLKSFMQRNK